MDTIPNYNNITFLLCLLCTIIMLNNSVTCNTMMNIHCNEHDKITLLKFKQGVTDPSGVLSSWLAKKDCCQWMGVRCENTTGRVTELNLPCHTIFPNYGDIDKSHCLTGELDLSLLDLEHLIHLNLSNNDFKTFQYSYSLHNRTCSNDLSIGTPFHQCGNSSNLHNLDLSYNNDLLLNNITWVSHLFSLQYLDLSGIDLHTETDWIWSVSMLPSLLELHLENCQLRNIYPSLRYANFTSLQVLDVAYNDFLSELPSWIFNLSSDVSHIDLSQNQIHGQLPETLPNLHKIKSLVLSENNLDGSIPNWLCQLEQLHDLDLSHNSISGSIPTCLGNLSSLTRLDLTSNDLTGNIPKSVVNLSSLEVLRISDNFFIGNISERNFNTLKNLKQLALGSPALIFDFDDEWIPPFQLVAIFFEYVVQKLPSWLYTQSSLKSLTIFNARASFEPLDKFWKFVAQLELLSLYNNSLNVNMSNVLLNSKVVWLDSNNLRGGVPQVTPNVTILNLYDNSLSGPLSPLLCRKMKERSKLQLLDISSNSLSGEIPNCWMYWEVLSVIDLGSNSLTGKIPVSIGSLSNLVSLSLYNNKLSGELPLSLRDCKNLWILSLSENQFSGVIPTWMDPNIKALKLRSNEFRGNIPTGICQLQSLKILDFANNRLSGLIPNCLQNMTSMTSEYASLDEFFIRIDIMNQSRTITLGVMLEIKGAGLTYYSSLYAIDLSSNYLSGTVPSELFMLIRLQSLNLSYNQLVEMIPEEIGNLKQLESLDLSCNRFSGRIPQSMSGMSFLEVLNLSFNNFMGEIPSGTQLQSFTNLSYMGNPQLCGPPLTKSCTQGGKPLHSSQVAKDDNDEESEMGSMFYMGLGIGFATGLWGVLGVIFFNKRFRHAYFRFVGKLYDMVLLKMGDIYWKLRSCYSGN